MDQIAKLEGRVDSLESRVNAMETKTALHDERINDIKDDIRSIKSNTTWLLRLVGGTIIIAAIRYFLLKSGGGSF